MILPKTDSFQTQRVFFCQVLRSHYLSLSRARARSVSLSRALYLSLFRARAITLLVFIARDATQGRPLDRFFTFFFHFVAFLPLMKDMA